LKTKDEDFDTFKIFKALVENERACKIKCLRTGHGGEFCSRSFHNYSCVEQTYSLRTLVLSGHFLASDPD
jgi:hypothetical protein